MERILIFTRTQRQKNWGDEKKAKTKEVGQARIWKRTADALTIENENGEGKEEDVDA